MLEQQNSILRREILDANKTFNASELTHLKFLLDEKTREISFLRSENESLRISNTFRPAPFNATLPPKLDELFSSSEKSHNYHINELTEIWKNQLKKSEEELSFYKSEHLKEKIKADNFHNELNNVQLSIQEFKTKNDTLEKNNIVFLDEIENLRQQENLLKTKLSAKQSPKIERIFEPVEKIVYQTDPVLIDENNKFSESLKKSLEEEKRAKNLLIELERKNQVLESTLNEFKTKINDSQKMKNDIPLKLELVIENMQKQMSHQNKRFVFQVLSLNSKYQKDLKKIEKKAKKTSDKILVSQKLEIIDGTFAVFNDFRSNFVTWIFDLFKQAADIAFSKKLNSFAIFKKQLIEIKSNSVDMSIVSSIWFRMKNLVEDELPKLKITKQSSSKFISSGEKQKAQTLEDEAAIETKNSVQVPISKGMEEWVLKNLIETVKKHKSSSKTNDDIILLVFRLIAVKYRIEFPLVSEKNSKISYELILVLDNKICSAVFKFLGSKTIEKPKNKRPSSQKPRFNVHF